MSNIWNVYNNTIKNVLLNEFVNKVKLELFGLKDTFWKLGKKSSNFGDEETADRGVGLNENSMIINGRFQAHTTLSYATHFDSSNKFSIIKSWNLIFRYWMVNFEHNNFNLFGKIYSNAKYLNSFSH